MDEDTFVFAPAPLGASEGTRTKIEPPWQGYTSDAFGLRDGVNSALSETGMKHLIRIDKKHPIGVCVLDNTHADLLDDWHAFVVNDLSAVRTRNLNTAIIRAKIYDDQMIAAGKGAQALAETPLLVVGHHNSCHRH
jgi:hypothetical protein